MKYIKNLFVFALSTVILFSFTACSDKKTESSETANIKVASDKKTEELIDDILDDNNKDKSATKDKYKSKLSDSAPKNPKLSDYDFKKGVSSTKANNTDSSHNSSNGGYSGSGYDTSSGYSGNSEYNNNSTTQNQDLVDYIKKTGTRDKGIYSISQLYNNDNINDKSTISLIYDEKLKDSYVELIIFNENHIDYTTYQLFVPNNSVKTKFIVSKSDREVAYCTYINVNEYNKNTKIDVKNVGKSEKEDQELSQSSTQNCYMMVSYLASQISKSGTGYTIYDYGFTNI